MTATTTAAQTATIDSLIADMVERRDEMQKQYDTATSVLRGQNRVIQIVESGLYIVVESVPEGNQYRITETRVTSIAHATRFTPKDADKIARTMELFNGKGEKLTLVAKFDGDALREEIVNVDGIIAWAVQTAAEKVA